MSARTWLARHAQTLVGSLGRIVQQPLATLMTTAVIAIAMAAPSLKAEVANRLAAPWSVIDNCSQGVAVAGWTLMATSEWVACSFLDPKAGTKESPLTAAGFHHSTVSLSWFGRAGSGRSVLTFPNVAAGPDRKAA